MDKQDTNEHHRHKETDVLSQEELQDEIQFGVEEIQRLIPQRHDQDARDELSLDIQVLRNLRTMVKENDHV